jgi:nitrite reductase (NADH) large subunit
MLDMLWCGDHDEDRSARFINDRVHANIQKDGTFSVVPRIRGGVTNPDELRRIADVADKYKVPMVKITGSQRIDLLGVKKEDLPNIWADLGMPSGQAYTKGVRMVKTCVGTDFCRFGTQDSTTAGIELERRFEQLYTPHKVKMGAVGCPRNCAEATVKDIGLVGQEGGWQVVVGGAAGSPCERPICWRPWRPRRKRSRRRSSSSSITARTRIIWSAPTTSSRVSASRRCGRRPCTRRNQ